MKVRNAVTNLCKIFEPACLKKNSITSDNLYRMPTKGIFLFILIEIVSQDLVKTLNQNIISIKGTANDNTLMYKIGISF